MKEKKNIKTVLWIVVPLFLSLVTFVLLVLFLGPNLLKPEPQVLKVYVTKPIEIRLVLPENDSQKKEGPPRFTGGSR